MATGIIDAARYSGLVPTVQPSGAFAEGMRAIIAGKEKTMAREAYNAETEEMRQAGILSQILSSGDSAGAMIDQFASTEGADDFRTELQQLRDIYQNDPQTAFGIVESSLRGSRVGSKMLQRDMEMKARQSQIGGRPQGWKPEWVMQDGEYKLIGTRWDPSTGEYSTQVIETTSDPGAYRRQIALESAYGSELGRGAGTEATAEQIAQAEALKAREVAMAKLFAGDEAQAEIDLKAAEATLPSVLETVEKLGQLAPVATHTLPGRAIDYLAKNLGFGETEGATAAARYDSIVLNSLLPDLKRMLGGAFTATEAQWVIGLMGDNSMGPEAKKAALEERVMQLMRTIEEKRRLRSSQSGRGAQEDRAADIELTPAAELSDDDLFR